MRIRIDAPLYSSSVLFRISRENTDQDRVSHLAGDGWGIHLLRTRRSCVATVFAPLKPRTLNPVDYGLKRPIPKAEAQTPKMGKHQTPEAGMDSKPQARNSKPLRPNLGD